MWLMGVMYKIVPDVLGGKYDQFAWTKHDSKELESFKRQYGGKSLPSMFDIGLEDHLFLLQLLLAKIGVVNPDAYSIKRCFERVFTYAIYNHGKLNEVHNGFPDSLARYFDGFDLLFTTNYDLNVDRFTGREVRHLHGSFDVLEDVYDSQSFRNHMSDAPLRESYFDPKYPYLFSNVIYSYSGSLKEFTMTMAPMANESIRKLAAGVTSDEGVRDTVMSWLDDDNSLTRRFAESIQLAIENPGLEFDECYPVAEFEGIEGSLEIVGLSPYNDTHLFDRVSGNGKIDEIVFYYHSNAEAERAKELFGEHDVTLRQVGELWETYR